MGNICDWRIYACSGGAEMTGYQSKRAAAQDKLDDDDTQVYQDDALTIAYQSGYYDGKKAAQPAQEPVTWAGVDFDINTTPPQRPWVGLTEKDFSAINQSCLTKLQAATSAESILKKKNT